MKEMGHNNLKTLRKLLASQPLVTELVVSFSIFSLVYSWSSLCSSSLIYYEKLYNFSWSSLQLLSIAMNKNCIFLICNGILVFLAKTSAFVRSPSSFDLNDMLQKKIGDGLQTETEPKPVLEKNIMVEESGESTDEDEKEDEKEVKGNEEEAEEFQCLNERPEAVSISIAESDEEGKISVHEDVEINDQREPKNCWLFDGDNDYDDDHDGQEVYAEEEEEEEEEEDETEKLSTEELNQKFEDFIRRMKEEFRISEARQLVMVN